MSRILIVDDEQPFLRTLGAHLERHGYDVDLVDTGEAAVARGSNGAHDLAIVDVGLPGINGVDVVHGAPRPDDDADHRAVGSARGILQDPGARRRCGRLRDEAVRDG